MTRRWTVAYRGHMIHVTCTAGGRWRPHVDAIQLHPTDTPELAIALAQHWTDQTIYAVRVCPEKRLRLVREAP